MESASPSPKSGASKRWMLALIVLAVVAGGIFAVLTVIKLRDPKRLKLALARHQMAQITAAIYTYQAGYGENRFPMSTNAASAGVPDFVFGTFNTGAAVEILNAGDGYQANNAEVIAILMAATTYPNGEPTPNADHALNPDRVKLITPLMAPDARSPGLGTDGVFRDPWGNPFIIAFDVGGDWVTESCFKGVDRPPVLPPSSVTGEIMQHSDHFCAQTRWLIWSFGPDGQADPALKVHEGVNADNLYSWR